MTDTSNGPPRPDHVVTMRDGRRVAVDEHGTAGGPVVVLLHSTPGSRLLDPDPAVTAEAGVRLLTLDRPGYGDSSPLAEGTASTVADRADDVASVLASLGISHAAIAGWSHGGQVAAAVAARYSEHVRAVAMIGAPAPDDDVPWLLEDQRAFLPALRADPGSAAAMLAPALAPMAGDLQMAVANSVVGEADEAVYRSIQPAFDRFLTGSIRQGSTGLAADIVAEEVAPWGFDPRTVGDPVHLFYGEADVVVPPPHADWWAERLHDCQLHLVSGAGHLVIVPAWKDILAVLT
jgi:pimeloyl-ACP methyl ester carboxylesterase